MKRRYDYVVYIGRFEPPHIGHLETVKSAFIYSKNVIIIIGTSNAALTPKNPFSAEQRIEMIKDMVDSIHPDADAKLHFITMEDRLYNDDKWTAYMQMKVHEIVGKGNAAIIGHDKGDSAYLSTSFPNMDFLDTGPFITEKEGDGKVLSATKIRELLFEGFVGFTSSNLHKSTYQWLERFTRTEQYALLRGEYEDFLREEEINKHLPHGMTYFTADSVVVQAGHILLVKRATYPGKGLWALPGVHVGLNETVDAASMRALRDETHLKVPEKVLKGSMVEAKKFDHPERSLRGRLTSKNARSITEAYHYKLDSNTPLPTNLKPGNGIEKVWWFPLGEIRGMRSKLFEDHADIIDYFIG